MSNAKCCDRCGKFYIKNNIVINRSFSNYPVVGFQYETTRGSRYPTIDLCNECLTELVEWMKGSNADDYDSL